MASPGSIVDSEDSESQVAAHIVDVDASSTTSSSSSSSSPLPHPRSSRDWNTKYRRLPKDRSIALRFMTWAAGRPRKANYVKKKYRDDDVDSAMFRVSTSTLIGSALGRWPRKTKMYWVTTSDDGDVSRPGAGGGDATGDENDDDEKDDPTRAPRVFVMSGGGGNGNGAGRGPVFVQQPPGFIPPMMPPQMDGRLPGMGPRLPPGMGGVPPLVPG